MSAQRSGGRVLPIVNVDVAQESFVEFAVDDTLLNYINNSNFEVKFTWCQISGGEGNHSENTVTLQNDSSFGFRVSGAGTYHYDLLITKQTGDAIDKIENIDKNGCELGDTIVGGAGDIIVK